MKAIRVLFCFLLICSCAPAHRMSSLAIKKLFFDQKNNYIELIQSGDGLLVTETEGQLSIWDLSSGKEVCVVADDNTGLGSGHEHLVSYISNQKRLVVFSQMGTANDEIVVLDLNSCSILSRHYEKDEEEFTDLFFSIFQSVSTDDEVGSVSCSPSFDPGGSLDSLFEGLPVRKFDISPDGTKIAVSIWLNPVVVINQKGKPCVSILGGEKMQKGAGKEPMFSPDSSKLVVVGAPTWSNLTVFNTVNFEPIFSLKHTAKISSTAISKDSTLLITGSLDGSARLFNLETAELINVFIHPPKTHINSVAISQDGLFVLTGADDGIARLWSAQSFDLLTTFNHGKPLLDLGFTDAASGNIITITKDIEVIIWQIGTPMPERL